MEDFLSGKEEVNPLHPEVPHVDTDLPGDKARRLKEGQKRTEIYMAGRRVSVTNLQKEQYEKLLRELDREQDGRGLENIPIGDPFYAKKQELDAFTAGF